MPTKPKKPQIDFTGNALVWDCETTAIPDWGQPAEKPEGHPHIVEIAAVLLSPAFERIDEFHSIIEPPFEGWAMDAEALATHGITEERAWLDGVSPAEMVENIAAMMGKATYMAGHNLVFDKKMLRIEMARTGLGDPEAVRAFPSWDTQFKGVAYAKLPPTPRMLERGRTGFKQPKLTELHAALFPDRDRSGAHTAIGDVNMAIECFEHIRTDEMKVAISAPEPAKAASAPLDFAGNE